MFTQSTSICTYAQKVKLIVEQCDDTVFAYKIFVGGRGRRSFPSAKHESQLFMIECDCYLE